MIFDKLFKQKLNRQSSYLPSDLVEFKKCTFSPEIPGHEAGKPSGKKPKYLKLHKLHDKKWRKIHVA